MTEIFDLYDSENKPLGKTKSRTDVHRDGDWHRTSHIYVVNGNGQFLVHLRSPQKDSKPNCWDTRFGGHVTTGMTYEQTAIQELGQEIGLIATADKLILGELGSYDSSTNREHFQTYYYLFNGNADELRFNDGEVAAIKWMLPDEIAPSMESSPEMWAGSIDGFKKILSFYKNLR